MKYILALLLVATTSPAAFAKKIDEFLATDAWCFADRSGQWDSGRFRFTWDYWGPNIGMYDVVDAPGPGAAEFHWNTFWTISNIYRITLWDAQGRTYQADMEIRKDGNSMVWYWIGPDYRRSTLNRCK
ncbi:MAG: hypothetical protein KF799_06855 [Bdellovibrionales bacterium]|nr:hypothetical protein [Bdellovibrionales bacterium]